MSQSNPPDLRLTEEGVQAEFQRHPHLLMKLAENAFTVAESLRNNYFKNTAQFVSALRKAINAHATGKRPDPILGVYDTPKVDWSSVQGEVVTFIDGGVGKVQLSSQVPILLRVGSYCVRTGERHLSEREQFGYYPVILGDLEGGSKERKDFIDIVRITAELLGGLSALERTPDLRMLMFHGPLVYMMSAYAGHTPFTEKDIDLFLKQYAPGTNTAHQLKEDFLNDAKLYIYPKMTPRSDDWVKNRWFEPLAWISWLYRRLIEIAKQRTPRPIIAGVVERGELREFSKDVLLERVFQGLRDKNQENYFNQMYGRTDLKSPKSLLDRLNYTDALLMAMLLQPGQYSESWVIAKYDGLREGRVTLPNEPDVSIVNFTPLKPENNKTGFPKVNGCYLSVSETTEPIRVETFAELGDDQIHEAVNRAHMYSRLLPGYGFPVGLDIADKFAKVPAWMTQSYGKLIRHHLGVSLQRGEISDAEMRRILVQAIYMTHRDWLFRPQS
ncbi:MAG: DNA double-strand break repair nuclease NurA [Acidobacteria bacterium]|nr:DNA double-strand break repair nuclease NurA [Acidobacteriota bacterium]